MTANEHSQIVTLKSEVVRLKAELAETKARLQRWMGSHKKWQDHAANLEQKLQVQANQRNAEEEYEWDPAPYTPGWKADGNHDWKAVREHRESRRRQVDDYNRMVAHQEQLRVQSTGEYQWDPSPTSPEFLRKEAA